MMLEFDLGLLAINLVLLSIVMVAVVFALLAGRNRRLETDDEGRLLIRDYR